MGTSKIKKDKPLK